MLTRSFSWLKFCQNIFIGKTNNKVSNIIPAIPFSANTFNHSLWACLYLDVNFNEPSSLKLSKNRYGYCQFNVGCLYKSVIFSFSNMFLFWSFTVTSSWLTASIMITALPPVRKLFGPTPNGKYRATFKAQSIYLVFF